jgi:SPP1 family predicted phage head-tail adaptor
MFKMTPSGELRHLVQFQSPSATQDAAGQPTTAWTTYFTTRCKIEILRGQLLYQTSEFISKNSYELTLRYPPDVTISVADRALFNSQVYVIQAIINVEQRNRELRLLAYVTNDTE